MSFRVEFSFLGLQESTINDKKILGLWVHTNLKFISSTACRLLSRLGVALLGRGTPCSLALGCTCRPLISTSKAEAKSAVMQSTWCKWRGMRRGLSTVTSGFLKRDVVVSSFVMRAAEIVPKGLLHVILQIQGLGTSLCRATVSETRMPVEERVRTWTLHKVIEWARERKEVYT